MATLEVGLLLSILVIFSPVDVHCEEFIPRGIVSLHYENANGVLLRRQISIPSGDLTQHQDRPEVSLPGSLQNPSSSTNFNNRHEYVIDGIRYLAILANSSLIILRDEGNRTTYHFSIPYPEGCRATCIQPGYPEGVFDIAFQQPCSPLTVDADYDPDNPDLIQGSPRLEGKKVIVLEGLDNYRERNTFPTYVGDTGNLVFHLGGASIEVTPSSIGSCSVLQDIHPFSTRSASGNLELIVDCLGENGQKLRYVAFIHHNTSVMGLFQVDFPDGIPLSDGHRYLAIIRNNGRSVTLIDVFGGSLPEATENFDSDVMQVKFLKSENVTSLEVYRNGRDLMSIDVSRFVASRGAEGKVERLNTMVSCDPVCNPVELMGDKFVMMAVFNSETLFYEFVYWPVDFSSTTDPVRIERVSSEPVILSFVQTGLEVVTSPPPDTPITTTFEPTPDETVTAETTTDSDEETTATTNEPTTAHPEPILDTPSLVLVIVLPTIVSVSVLCLLICTPILIGRQRRKKRPMSLEDPPPYPSAEEHVDATNPLTPHFQLEALQGTGNAVLQQPGLISPQPDPSLPQTENLQRGQSVEPVQASPPMVQPVSARNSNGHAEKVVPTIELSSSPETGFHAQESEDSGRSSYNSSTNSSPRTSTIFVAVTSSVCHLFSSDKHKNITVERTEPLH